MDLEHIANDDTLLRRLTRDSINPDSSVNSNAYKLSGKPDNSISVDLERLTDEETTASYRPGSGVGRLITRVPRELGFDVFHAPLINRTDQPDNPAHCLIEGNNTKQKCRLLAEATEVARPPTNHQGP